MYGISKNIRKVLKERKDRKKLRKSQNNAKTPEIEIPFSAYVLVNTPFDYEGLARGTML